MTDFMARFEPLLGGVDEGTRERVRNALASSMHEGWEPSEDDVRMLVRIDQGLASEAERLAWLTSR